MSPENIAELERGGQWGLAKVAELNGLPGPAHLLELENEIELTGDQLNEIQILHDEMREQAIENGKRLIMLEGELEARFQHDLPTETDLKTMLIAIEKNALSCVSFICLHISKPLTY
ncbi:hypothetical protein [Granulosicoccus antarcticus]|uniref:Uncharacterized protein n=1 Tax=Granulosicoccus antarcticus IMCC3135 TaxID=1192854 RepID=A0A2Z2NWS9_9GAMM|nr:hypothetical protein [Granulosicoccus antarcticus]ASJ73300.1 hypothetical protein IMCC3135_16090 [Granulosicoccus antarcticus IMCC3135]